LLSLKEGKNIAATAIDLDTSSRSAQDCSHLVHQVYSAAGFAYTYASSFDLYAGLQGNFQRVRHPQAGDLVAWPGHVGIVLDPRQHSFYSLVRSGLQAENYFSPYWRSRGTARFYRYILDSGSSVRTVKAKSPVSPSSRSSARRNSAAIAEVHADSEPSAQRPPAEEASLRSKMIAPAPELETENPEPASSNIFLVTPEQRRPTAAELTDAIGKRCDASADVFRTPQPLNTKTPVVIFDEIRVEKIETKHDKGWAHLQIDSHVQVASEGADFKHRREKMKWELRRDATGWTAIAPAERAFVARDAAIRVLAAQLAEMSQSEAAAQHDETVIGQEARIANLLSALLEK
jgi:hypothetical protein